MWTRYRTPVGDLAVVARESQDGTPAMTQVVAAGFCPPEDLFERLAKLGDKDVQVPPGPPVDPIRLGSIHSATEAYLDGDLDALNQVTLQQRGTELQQRFWNELRAIPPGQTRTYSQLATAAGRPRAIRAAGTACGANLIAPYVPCHRVQRSDGSLGGYYYGLEVKKWLLDHENKC